jgi:hypothetical protein
MSPLGLIQSAKHNDQREHIPSHAIYMYNVSVRWKLAGQLCTAVWKETGGKFFILRSLGAMNYDNHNRRMQWREYYHQRNVLEYVNKTNWSDEASCNLSGTMNRHKWVY